ncbi:MAG: 30S ribosomal protein S2 [Candidatus Daviesbacteria bacterium]|nr:30S ribosomal protein S2 [Candidatus Daviesbacteria bacterium]
MIKTPTMQELLEAGVHFGHQVRRGNPRMGEFIFGAREGVHIINLEFSEKLLQKAADYVYKLGTEGKVILFVGTKKQASDLISESATKLETPYVNFKWLGGLLTNFDEIRKNIDKLLDLKAKSAKGELSHYTKKEQLLISRKIEKFEKENGGIADMHTLPDALFIIDCVNEKTAVTEANRIGIPIVAICDTNSNPAFVSYPIPGNDDATKSIKIITETIVNAYAEGLEEAKKLIRQLADKSQKDKEDAEKKEQEKLDNPEILAEVEKMEEEVEKVTVGESKRIV